MGRKERCGVGWCRRDEQTPAQLCLLRGCCRREGEPSPAPQLSSKSKHDVAKIQDKAVGMQALMSAVG